MNGVGTRLVPTVVVVVVVTALFAGSVPAAARTWVVNPAGTGDAPTIQAAAESTAAGDSILVLAGAYSGTVSLKPDTHLVGEDPPGSASIDAQGATPGVNVVSGSVSGLDLFGAQGGYGFLGTAISALDADITDCTLRDCDRALTADGAFSVRMRGCSIERTGGILTSSCNGSLDIRDCVFTDNTSLDASVVTVLATVTCTSELFVSGCEFVRSPAFDFGTPTVGWEGAVQATVTGNLFRDNAAAAAGPTVFTVPKAGPRGSRAGGSIVEISSNTIARLDAAGIIGKLPPGSSIHANAVTGCVQGVQLAEMTGVSFTCNLVWGNGQDYVGGPDLTGTDGNLSEPPKYCDPDAGDFTVAANSPLLPGGNSCGVPIGAFGEGCGDVSVEPSSWGRIKGLYRE